MSKKMNKIVSTLGFWCATIGLSLCVIGISIVMVSGIFGQKQIVGTLLSVIGVSITSLTLPLIAIKMIINNTEN